jgi:hypothetical protein
MAKLGLTLRIPRLTYCNTYSEHLFSVYYVPVAGDTESLLCIR